MGKKLKQKQKYLQSLDKASSRNSKLSMSAGKSKQNSKIKLSGRKRKKLLKSMMDSNAKLPNSASDTSNRKQKVSKDLSLRERLLTQLSASRFRYINEELYRADSQVASKMFATDKESFSAYHEGFQQQVSKWPINPVDKMIEYVQEKGSHLVVADFGCGDAKIARSLENKVHSFDLVALNEHVTVCDMAKVPLKKQSVDVAIFCLSLMGTNIGEFIKEANRVLKLGGTLLIAEVTSRFHSLEEFQTKLRILGFTCKIMDTTTSKMFVWLRLKKTKSLSSDRPAPEIELKPCVYNKRKSTKS